jgi:hypothetical protein
MWGAQFVARKYRSGICGTRGSFVNCVLRRFFFKFIFLSWGSNLSCYLCMWWREPLMHRNIEGCGANTAFILTQKKGIWLCQISNTENMIQSVKQKQPCSLPLQFLNFSWCAPSSLCVRLPEPAPRKLERRRSKLKLANPKTRDKIQSTQDRFQPLEVWPIT